MMHSLTLALDGSTYAGSVAVIRGNELISGRNLPESPTPGRAGREERFLPMVADCLGHAGITVGDLDRIVCGSGPGSFTSLRVAASIAKGIAVGTGRPLFAVSSLMLAVTENASAPGRYLAAMPAMRGESYVALFRIGDDGFIEQEAPAKLIAGSFVAAEALSNGATLTGEGADEKHSHPPHARGVARVLAAVIDTGKVEILTWEPSYGRLAEAQVKWEAMHGKTLSPSE